MSWVGKIVFLKKGKITDSPELKKIIERKIPCRIISEYEHGKYNIKLCETVPDITTPPYIFEDEIGSIYKGKIDILKSKIIKKFK